MGKRIPILILYTHEDILQRSSIPTNQIVLRVFSTSSGYLILVPNDSVSGTAAPTMATVGDAFSP